MNKFTPLICAFIFALSDNSAKAEEFKKIYLDQKNNVHLLTENGKHRQITYDNSAHMAKLANDKETVAWLTLNTWTAEGDNKPGSNQLVIYRNGKFSSIKCDPFIREFWFQQNGDQIAIDCGGRHFAGQEILYDTKTLKKLATFHQAEVPLEKRPDWSNTEN